MYAILEIAGMQYKVSPGRFMYVPYLNRNQGDELIFNKVLLFDDQYQVTIGTPNIEGIQVKGKILAHVKADKVTVFKKKRRKGYKLKRGHRQQFTKIEIVSINTTVTQKEQLKNTSSQPSESVDKQSELEDKKKFI